MALAGVCSKASTSFEPVIACAETLKLEPNHLQVITTNTENAALSERMCVGGEVLERADFDTLQAGKWLNDKVSSSSSS